MIKVFLALAYPFACLIALPFCLFDCFVCGPSPFAMIIDLLMWADVRNTRGQQGSDGSAA